MKDSAKKVFLLVMIISTLFVAALALASSEEEKIKYSELEKEEVREGSQEALQDYYSDVIEDAGRAEFNTIASTGNIAIINVTIDGQDKRILTKLNMGTVVQQSNLTNFIETISLLVRGNISLKGLLISAFNNDFGERNVYDIKSASSRYIDEGFARLYNGTANVSINPILREQISGYNIFLSAYGRTRGIYIAEKSKDYFAVKSLNENSNVAFSWMLSAARKNPDEYLSSQYGRENGVEIKATIDNENKMTHVKISGLENVYGLIEGNVESAVNQAKGINATNQITGNVIEEIIPETSLDDILADEPTVLPKLLGEDKIAKDANGKNSSINDSAAQRIIPEANLSQMGNIGQDMTVNKSIAAGNATSNETRVLEFTLHSINENSIVEQIAFVTSLSLGEVKKLIRFEYKEPEGFEDELIEESGSILPYPDFVEKVNGTVIIRVG